MNRNNFFSKEGKMYLKSYDGFCDKKRIANKTGRKKENERWYFSREWDNFVYSNNSNINCFGGCGNNLIIAKGTDLSLENVRNAFVFGNNSQVEVSPISKIKNIIDIASETLPEGGIHYIIPKGVSLKDNHPELNIEKIEKKVKDFYGVGTEKIQQLKSGKPDPGIYKIRGDDGKDYVLRHVGESRKKVETQAQILAGVQEFFPEIYPRKDLPNKYGINIENKFYIFEEFIEGSPIKKENLYYFSSIGSSVARLHNKLDQFSKSSPDLERVLESNHSSFNESNFIARYIDLTKNKMDHNFLLNRLEKLIESNIIEKFRFIPSSLVHGDLNTSNILKDKYDRVKIIDPETLKSSHRITEFIPLLLLDGEGETPSYMEGSLSRLRDGYNLSAEKTLLNLEMEILPRMLEASILKYYVVKNIRRKKENERSLQKTKLNLTKIKENYPK